MSTIDPLAVATAGFLDSNGNTDPFLVAVEGFGIVIQVTPVYTPTYTPTGEPEVPQKPQFDIEVVGRDGLEGLGGLIGKKKKDVVYSIEEDDEEIIMIIELFLNQYYGKKGLDRLFT